MNISKAAELSGLPDKTLRYYGDIGLVVPERGENGYRDYSAPLVRDLVFLRRARQFGFSLEDCGKLLALFREPSRRCAEVHSLAVEKLVEMDSHIRELLDLRAELAELVSSCPNDENPDCTIIESLSGEVAP